MGHGVDTLGRQGIASPPLRPDDEELISKWQAELSAVGDVVET